ncbi:hypothetical protein PVAP13_3NG052627 [Panicum virgatum]|uniref:Uncharacterized protein n=1 Tax=Panicum virgatum TaxID=38727 RepID=A0A8T0U431_PANVG|nr:hypothetical protein PVAP13_3NG052627 [Panicum virgatum]KAG2615844.1 hypothetical protein PVAP13_3NG052627 [Panicum virgatum]
MPMAYEIAERAVNEARSSAAVLDASSVVVNLIVKNLEKWMSSPTNGMLLTAGREIDVMKGSGAADDAKVEVGVGDETSESKETDGMKQEDVETAVLHTDDEAQQVAA